MVSTSFWFWFQKVFEAMHRVRQLEEAIAIDLNNAELFVSVAKLPKFRKGDPDVAMFCYCCCSRGPNTGCRIMWSNNPSNDSCVSVSMFMTCRILQNLFAIIMIMR